MSSNEEEITQYDTHAPKPKSGVRMFSRHRKKDATKEHPVQSGFYSGCVTKCFDQIKAHTLKEEMKHALEDEGDVEDDLLLRCSKKKELPSIPSSHTLQDIVISDEEDATVNCLNLRNSSEENINANAIKSPSPPPPPPPQAHGKKRTRATKQKKNLLNAVDNYTKSLSAAQKELLASQLVQNVEPEVCVIDGDDMVTVRVDHRGSLLRYTICPDDPFSTIIRQIGEKENVPEKCVMLVHNDKTLRPTDSPYSVNLQIADIIECHITSSLEDSLNDSCEQEDPNIIEVVVQSQGSKQRALVKTHINKPVSNIISQYAKRMKKDAECLLFTFDGEELAPEQTPKMLDMEDGDILDVKEVEGLFTGKTIRSKKAKLASQSSEEVIHIG